MTNSHLQKAPCSPSYTQYRVQKSQHSGISWLSEHSSHQSVFRWNNYLQCIKSPTSCNWKNRYFISMVPLKQGYSVLLLEGQSPAEFSSNLPKNKIPSITENLELLVQVCLIRIKILQDSGPPGEGLDTLAAMFNPAPEGPPSYEFSSNTPAWMFPVALKTYPASQCAYYPPYLP